MSRKINTPAVSRRAFNLGAVAAVGAAGMTVAACGGGSDSDSASAVKGSQADLDAALEKGGEITYWSWTPSADEQIKAFEKAYPNCKVKFVNNGTNTDQYTKMTTAIEAGSGAPDVAQIEYYAFPQYALSDSLLDLDTAYAMSELKDSYTSSTWNSVAFDGKVYGLPQDSGPMAMFYNKKVFDAAGVTTAPTTWDEYIAAAKKIHEYDAKTYIVADPGDAGFMCSMIWQAGGHPFTVTNNTEVSINFEDEGTKKFTAMWNQLHENDLLADTALWSDAWFKGLTNGTLASLITGAWMPGNLESSAAGASGDWRVAPIPTYDGAAVTSENGGSGQAVLKQSKSPALAAAFVRWLNHDSASLDIFIESGGFPSTTSELGDPDFTEAKSKYFGNTQINKTLADAASQVQPNWAFLPYQAHANTIFGDTVGKTSYTNRTDLNEGLAAWKAKLDEYGKQQGFTVK